MIYFQRKMTVKIQVFDHIDNYLWEQINKYIMYKDLGH